MSNWIRKSFVVLVTIFTFGMVSPAQAALLYDNSTQDRPAKRNYEETAVHTSITDNEQEYEEQLETSSKEEFIKNMVKQAELQSYEKFGTKIKPVIEDEFCDVILPNIEKAIEDMAVQYPEEDLAHLTITEAPTGGHSEMIFHIFNEETAQDVIRFHVRKDHPPQQGYWFNFHYHTYHDSFQMHHELGAIYWDKNTPPKWMS